MVAGCGAKLSKMILFIVNFLVWVVGVALIGVGGYILARPGDFADFFGPDTSSLKAVCGLVIAVGCLVFLLAFAGCCGAMKESSCLLKMYIAVLLILVIVEVIGGILAIVFRGSIEETMAATLLEQIKKYEVTTEKNSIDVMQEGGECCGSTTYMDWKDSQYQKDNAGQFVPTTCCKKVAAGCNAGTADDITDKSLIYVDGCITNLVAAVEENFLIIGAVALSLVAAEILAMIFACCVISGIGEDSD